MAKEHLGEFEELVGIYQAKGLGRELAQQVAAALTERDPVAAHADAELRLDDLDTTSRAVPAGVGAGISYGIGAALPLTGILWLPSNERIILTFVVVMIALGLTGWLASLTPPLPDRTRKIPLPTTSNRPAKSTRLCSWPSTSGS